MDDACDAQERTKGLCCAYHRSLFLSEVSDAYHHSSFGEEGLVNEGFAGDSGFEILSIEWANETEFTIEMKLIDEDIIYTGYCSAGDQDPMLRRLRVSAKSRTTKELVPLVEHLHANTACARLNRKCLRTIGGKAVLQREKP